MDEWVYLCKDKGELIYDLVVPVTKPQRKTRKFIENLIVATRILLIIKDWLPW